jgi:hypothetical protein
MRPPLPFDRWLLAALLAALVALVGLRHGALLSPAPLADEGVYAAALEAAAAGRPLSEVPGWYYPDALAKLGALAAPMTALYTLRALNLAGTALTMAWSGRLLHPRLGPALAAGLALWSPAEVVITAGNVSGLLTGLILLAWSARGIARTLLLAAGFAFKPYALGVALGRPPRESWLPLIACALAVLGASGRGDFTNLEASSNLALVRPMLELGLPAPWWLPSGLVLAIAATWGRGSWTRGMALGWLSLPLVWEHTALLLLPPLAAAARRTLDAAAGQERTLELLLLAAAALVMDGGHYFGHPDRPALSAALGLVPALCAAGVAWRTADPEVAPAQLGPASPGAA